MMVYDRSKSLVGSDWTYDSDFLGAGYASHHKLPACLLSSAIYVPHRGGLAVSFPGEDRSRNRREVNIEDLRKKTPEERCLDNISTHTECTHKQKNESRRIQGSIFRTQE